VPGQVRRLAVGDRAAAARLLAEAAEDARGARGRVAVGDAGRGVENLDGRGGGRLLARAVERARLDQIPPLRPPDGSAAAYGFEVSDLSSRPSTPKATRAMRTLSDASAATAIGWPWPTRSWLEVMRAVGGWRGIRV
jgi:hypothetical protein